jgi:GAF domain-containing protein
LQSGEHGSEDYRAAWLRFRQRIRTIEDLRRWRFSRADLDVDAVELLTEAIDHAILIDGCAMADAQLLNPGDRTLRIVAHSGFGTDFLEFFQTVDGDWSACGRALRRGRPVWVPDTVRSPIFAGTPALDVMIDAHSRAVASVPIMSPDGWPIGMISTHHPRRVSWTARRRLGLESLAKTTGRQLEYLLRAERPAAGL